MYAIVRTGGHQYKVQAGEVLRVSRLEKKLGEQFDLTDVLMIGGEQTIVGAPTVKNAKVTVVVTNHDREKKILVFKKKRRQGYRKTQGHRQDFTELFIKSITSPDGKTAAASNTPVVIDPVKIAARKKLAAEKAKAQPKEVKTAKKVAKKAATTKKAAGKSTVAKKAAGKKTAAKKTAKKTTTKKSSK